MSNIYDNNQEENLPDEKPSEKFWRILWYNKGKLIWLNVLVVACSLPIITVGPVMTAMMYVLREIVDERLTYTTSDFFLAFKKNWKQALPIGILHVGFTIAIGFAAWYYYAWLSQKSEGGVLAALAATIVVLILFLMAAAGIYLYQLISGCQLSSKDLIKDAIYLGIIELKSNAVTVLIMLAIILLLLSPTLFISVWFYPISLLLVALVGLTIPNYIAVYRSKKHIAKYVTDPYYQNISDINE